MSGSPVASLAGTNGMTINTAQLIEIIHRPGEHTILGLSGQAGAGKTTLSTLLLTAAVGLSIPHVRLQLDWYFKLSSLDRRAWLNEPRLSPEEVADRRDQINWWDFDRLVEDLLALRRGETVNLRGVYNRDDGGELTANVDLIPSSEGTLFTIEGVAIAHLGRNLLDLLVFLHVPSWTRFARLAGRDSHRYGIEHDQRFALTQAFEIKYFGSNWSNFDLFVDHSGAVPVIIPKRLARKELLLELTSESEPIAVNS